MSYSLIIEGRDGARKVRSGLLPRRGEWLNLGLGDRTYWFQVHEVCYALTDEERLTEAEDGCEFVHDGAQPIVFTSLATSTAVGPLPLELEEENFKLVFPPTRWPFGGRQVSD